MTVIQKSGNYELHADLRYEKAVDLYVLVFSSTFGDCRFPDEHQRLLSLNLTSAELQTLIDVLT